MRDPERTKEAILEAAQAVVLQKGIETMTIDEVAAQARVSKGGLLHHFPSKIALAQGLMSRLVSRFDVMVERYRKKDPAMPGAYTRAYLRATLDCETECADIWTALVTGSGMAAESMVVLRASMKRWQRQLENDGLEPEVASIVRLAGEGLCGLRMHKLPGPSKESRVIRMLLAMARGQSTIAAPPRKNSNHRSQ